MNLKLAQALVLKPGSGELDVDVYVRPNAAGGSLSYAHHLVDGLAVGATGWAGAVRDPMGWRADYGAVAGLRYRW